MRVQILMKIFKTRQQNNLISLKTYLSLYTVTVTNADGTKIIWIKKKSVIKTDLLEILDEQNDCKI